MDVPSALVSTIYDPDADPAPGYPTVPAGPAPQKGKLNGILLAGGLQPAPGALPAVPPMPAPQPLPDASGQPGVGVSAPRGPVTAFPLNEAGVVVIRTGDPRDMEIVLQLLDFIRKQAEGTEPELRLVPLKHQDCNSIAGTLNSIFSRVLVGQTGNYVPAAARQVTPGNALTALAGAPSATQNVYCVALPRFNALLIAGPKGRFADIVKEVEKLDQPHPTEMKIRAFQLRKASAQVVALQIRSLYSQRFAAEGPPNMQFRISFDLPSNSVLVQAAPADMADIAELIEKLDTLVPVAVNDVRIFPLKNALADELGQVLAQALTANVQNPTLQSNQPWYLQTVTGTNVGALGGLGALLGGGQLGGGQLGGGQLGGGQLGGGQLGGGQLGQLGGGLGGLGGGAAGTANLSVVVPTIGTASAGGVATKTNALRFYSTVDKQVVETGFLEDVHIVPNARTNALLVTAKPETMRLIEKLIESLDTVAAARAYINIFSLKTADATLTALMLQQLFTGQARTGLTPAGGAGAGAGAGAGLGGAGAAGQAGTTRPLLTVFGDISPGASLIDLRISVDDRTNSIIVAGSLNDLETIRTIIARLEASDAQQRQFDVYKLRNQAAADVATSLQTFLTNSLNVYSGAAFLTAYQQLQRNVVLVPEPVSNTIMISATPQYFNEIKRLIERIDAQPPQVVIEVLIAEVQLTNNEEYGAEFGLQSPVLFQRSGGPGTIGFNFNTTQPLPNAVAASPGTVAFQGLGNLGVGRASTVSNVGGFVFSAQSESFNLLVRALKAQGRVDILSRPHIQVADSQTGFVQVGQDFPYPTGLSQNGLQTLQGIDYRPIGVVLRVTPRVNPDGKVIMRVEPQISSVDPILVSLGGGVSAPSFSVESVQTTVLAADGETVALGGLITKRETRNETGVPFFKDIPGVGALFRYRTRQINRREVLVIMTPHIIRTEFDHARVLAEEARRMSWCVPDVAAIHGHGLEVIGPAMNGANPQPIGGTVPGAIPPGMLPAGFGPGFLPPETRPGPGIVGGFELPPGAVLPGPGGFPGGPQPVPLQPGVPPQPGLPPGAFPPAGPTATTLPAAAALPAMPAVPPTVWPAQPPAGVPVLTPMAPTAPVIPAGAVTQPQVGRGPTPPTGTPFVMTPPGSMTTAAVPTPAVPIPAATQPATRGFIMMSPPAKDEPAKPADKVKEDRPWNVYGR